MGSANSVTVQLLKAYFLDITHKNVTVIVQLRVGGLLSWFGTFTKGHYAVLIHDVIHSQVISNLRWDRSCLPYNLKSWVDFFLWQIFIHGVAATTSRTISRDLIWNNRAILCWITAEKAAIGYLSRNFPLDGYFESYIRETSLTLFQCYVTTHGFDNLLTTSQS